MRLGLTTLGLALCVALSVWEDSHAMELAKNQQCHGHLIVSLPADLTSVVEITRAEFGVSAITPHGTMTPDEFKELVESRAAALAPISTVEPLEVQRAAGRALLLSRDISLGTTGGEMIGLYYTNGTAFETQNAFSDRLLGDFSKASTAVGAALRPFDGISLPVTTTFCTGDFYVNGPVDVTSQGDYTAQLRISPDAHLTLTSTSTSEPLLGLDQGTPGFQGARSVAGFDGVEIILEPGQVLRDGPLTVAGGRGVTYIFEGSRAQTPELSLSLILRGPPAKATTEQRRTLDALWVQFLDTAQPVPALAAR